MKRFLTIILCVSMAAALPDNAELQYPFYPNQAGEGVHILEDAETSAENP